MALLVKSLIRCDNFLAGAAVLLVYPAVGFGEAAIDNNKNSSHVKPEQLCDLVTVW